MKRYTGKRILGCCLCIAVCVLALAGCQTNAPDTSENDLVLSAGGNSYTVTGEEGNRVVQDQDGNILASDENGDTISINKDGSIHITTQNGGEVSIKNNGTVEKSDGAGNSAVYYPDGNIVISTGDDTYIVSGEEGNRVVQDQAGNILGSDEKGDSISVDADGTVHITDTTGGQVSIKDNGTVQKTDEAGNVTVIYPSGTTSTDATGSTTTGNNNTAGSTTSTEDDGEPAPSGGKATITLNGTSATVSGSGATAEGSTVYITAGGSYTIKGNLTDGRIIVDAEKQEVALTLDGASIHCSYSAPLYVYHSKQTTITLKAGTTSTLTDGTTYTYTDEYSSEADEEPNACLYSKSDLVIAGGGKLSVTSNFNNGITSKDTLTIQSATVAVTSKNHGINGKDYLSVSDASITVNSKGDALRSTNDSGEQNESGNTLGYVILKDSTLNLTAVEDAVQAESTLTITNCKITATTTGNPSSVSAKGLKSTGDMVINSGTFVLNCTDDAVHSNANVTVKGGTFTVDSGDDAFHADETLTVSGGTITVNSSYEGLEGNLINISGGTIRLKSSDDGINAAGGVDNSGGFYPSSSGNSGIQITGGYVVVNANGDGVDSNGTIHMSDGTLIILGPTGGGNGALDYDSTFTITGGVMMAQGSKDMAQSPNDLSQYALSLTFNQSLSAGTYVQLKIGDEEVVLQIQKTTQNLIYTSPAIQKGDTVTVSYGGTYNGGTVKDGICSGGSYSGGTTLTTLTIADYLTTYGSVGIGGSMGGGSAGKPGRPGSFGGWGW